MRNGKDVLPELDGASSCSQTAYYLSMIGLTLH
jgi:hypothetical protein